MEDKEKEREAVTVIVQDVESDFEHSRLSGEAGRETTPTQVRVDVVEETFSR